MGLEGQPFQPPACRGCPGRTESRLWCPTTALANLGCGGETKLSYLETQRCPPWAAGCRRYRLSLGAQRDGEGRRTNTGDTQGEGHEAKLGRLLRPVPRGCLAPCSLSTWRSAMGSWGCPVQGTQRGPTGMRVWPCRALTPVLPEPPLPQRGRPDTGQQEQEPAPHGALCRAGAEGSGCFQHGERESRIFPSGALSPGAESKRKQKAGEERGRNLRIWIV